MLARLACLLLAAALAWPAAAQTFPQSFPSRPIRIIVVYPPGGTSDAVTSSSQEQFAQVVQREYEANAKVVAKAGIRSE